MFFYWTEQDHGLPCPVVKKTREESTVRTTRVRDKSNQWPVKRTAANRIGQSEKVCRPKLVLVAGTRADRCPIRGNRWPRSGTRPQNLSFQLRKPKGTVRTQLRAPLTSVCLRFCLHSSALHTLAQVTSSLLLANGRVTSPDSSPNDRKSPQEPAPKRVPASDSTVFTFLRTCSVNLFATCQCVGGGVFQGLLCRFPANLTRFSQRMG